MTENRARSAALCAGSGARRTVADATDTADWLDLVAERRPEFAERMRNLADEMLSLAAVARRVEADIAAAHVKMRVQS